MASPTELKERDFTKCKVICFNGPPGSGKSTASRSVWNQIYYHAPWMQPYELTFSEPVKRAVHALYNVPYAWNHYDQKGHMHEKDVPCDVFMGLSPRQAYIAESDAIIARHNAEFLGWIMRRRMRLAQGVMVYMLDCGMAPQLFPVITLVGSSNVLIVELEAKGKNFTDDSRGYIGADIKKEFPKVHVRRIFNDIGNEDDLELFKVYCWGSCRAFLGIEERE